MNVIKLILITFLTFNCVYAQSWEVKISGNLKSSDNVMLSEIPILLCTNNDTMFIVKTDENGEFEFKTTFTYGNDYILKLNIENQNPKDCNFHLFSKEDTARMSEYQLDLKLPILIHDKFDNSVYYELNEIKNFQNFEMEWFKGLLTRYPEMCLEFVQTINPIEKQKIAQKRIKHFQEELVKANCDMKRISFRNETLILSDQMMIEDSRSRIQGIIISMDGDCKK